MRRAVAVLVTIAIAVAVGACGGSSKSNANARAKTRDTSAGNEGATVVTFTGAGSGPFCAIAGPFVHGTDIASVLTDPASAEARVKELQPLIDEGRRKAPPEIKADVERVTDGVARAFDALATANYQVLKVDRSAIESLIDDQRFQDSAMRIGEYAHQVCKVG